ncbi:MAG: succinylglutamate desuccinylase/aspartoacylase family protein [Gammaproteobacteria bacterium]|nr:succinylglutamate desuccinylase/aspartoacylase family protein [Gammaproteobacteria bacterium]
MTFAKTDIALPTMSSGTQRTLTVFRYGSENARPKAYLHTALHADENPGILVMHHLMALLNDADKKDEIKGEITLVPVANPIGLSQHIFGSLQGRFEFSSSQNFNRNYPDIAQQVVASVEKEFGDDATANIDLIRWAMHVALDEFQPNDELGFLRRTFLRLAVDSDICLDLHCDWDAVLHVYTTPTLWPDASDLCAQLGSETTLLAEVSGGHPFDEAVGGVWQALAQRYPHYSIPAACLSATVELRGETDVSDESAKQDAKNLFRFLQRRKIITGDPGPLPQCKCEATPLTGVDTVKAPVPGVVVYHKQPGDYVEQGETVATIVNPLNADAGAARTDVKSRTNGVVYARRSDRFTRPGQTLCRIAGKTPLPDRTGNLLSD